VRESQSSSIFQLRFPTKRFFTPSAAVSVFVFFAAVSVSSSALRFLDGASFSSSLSLESDESEPESDSESSESSDAESSESLWKLEKAVIMYLMTNLSLRSLDGRLSLFVRLRVAFALIR